MVILTLEPASKKSQKRKRNFRHETEVATADQKVVARNLGLR